MKKLTLLILSMLLVTNVYAKPLNHSGVYAGDLFHTFLDENGYGGGPKPQPVSFEVIQNKDGISITNLLAPISMTVDSVKAKSFIASGHRTIYYEAVEITCEWTMLIKIKDIKKKSAKLIFQEDITCSDPAYRHARGTAKLKRVK